MGLFKMRSVFYKGNSLTTNHAKFWYGSNLPVACVTHETLVKIVDCVIQYIDPVQLFIDPFPLASLIPTAAEGSGAGDPGHPAGALLTSPSCCS